MGRPTKLNAEQLQNAMQRLPGWSLSAGKLHRNWRFADFAEAFAFMTEVAREAEAMDHHPDWSNVYDRVVIDLQTHDAGGITELDIELAERIDALIA